MSTSADTTDLREPWRTLWRRKFLIVLTTAVVGAVAFGAAMLQAPRYQAATDILFETPESPVTESLSFSPSGGATSVDPVRALQTEIQLVRSEAVKDAVRRSLAVDVAPEIVVEPVGQSNLIRIIAGDRNADHAAAIANAYAESYILFRRGTATSAAEKALAAEIAEVDQQINLFDEQINAAPPDPRADVLAKQASVREALISEYVTLSTRLRQVRVGAAARKERVSVVVPAMAPTSPASPKPLIATALGVAWGAMLGVTMAFIIERLSGRRRLAQRALPGDARLTNVATSRPWRRRRVAENGSESGAQGLPVRSAGRPETGRAGTALDEHVGGGSLPSPDGETG